MRSKKTKKVGIIVGSGVKEFDFTRKFKKKTFWTKYGRVEGLSGEAFDKEIIFLARHGFDYSISPSRINYRANIAAMEQEKVNLILATAAVGSMRKNIRPGDLVLLDDFIDLTRCRKSTFFEERPRFTDMTRPYSRHLNTRLKKSAKSLKSRVHSDLVYVCTEGPRFETRAEIKMFARFGADVVGMTSVPEVVLAAEAGIPYAALGIVSNYACGISKTEVSMEEVVALLDKKQKTVEKILELTIRNI